MGERGSLLTSIEEKIRALGEQLQAARTNNAALQEEINALKNKNADLENIIDDTTRHQGGMKSDQIDSIKKELGKYINEVEHCIDMVKQI